LLVAIDEDSFEGVHFTLGYFELGLLPPVFCVTAAAIIIIDDDATAAACA
jgi:hypothetical protein